MFIVAIRALWTSVREMTRNDNPLAHRIFLASFVVAGSVSAPIKLVPEAQSALDNVETLF